MIRVFVVDCSTVALLNGVYLRQMFVVDWLLVVTENTFSTWPLTPLIVARYALRHYRNDSWIPVVKCQNHDQRQQIRTKKRKFRHGVIDTAGIGISGVTIRDIPVIDSLVRTILFANHHHAFALTKFASLTNFLTPLSKSELRLWCAFWLVDSRWFTLWCGMNGKTHPRLLFTDGFLLLQTRQNDCRFP